MENKENTFKKILHCYKAFATYNPNLHKLVTLQTLILIASRSTVAFFALALSHFINKITEITLFETFAISVISFYCFNRMLEWFISAIHGRLHTQFILPTAFKFIDNTIYSMLRHHNELKLDKNPVEIATLLNKKQEARGFLGFLLHHISMPIFELIICSILLISLGFGWIGFLFIPVAIIYLMLTMHLMPKVKNRLALAFNVASRSNSTFSSSLEKASLAATFGTTETLVEHLKGITKKETEEFTKSALLNDFMATALNFPLALFACIFFYLGAQQVNAGATTYGAFAVLISIVMNSFSQFKNLTFAFDGLNQSLTALTPHLEIFDKVQKIENSVKPERLTNQNFKSLELKDFRVFHDQHELFNLSFKISNSEKIFIVGSSGAGKTSLMRAILGFKPYHGNILINGTPLDLNTYPFAWMPQETQAIEGSVRFNLQLGNPQATDEQMYEALKIVHLYDKVQSIGGLNANLTYQGSNLSGGENQRLSLARCLLSDNPIMILDEPSSALDLQLEQQVFNYLNNSSKTALIIAHRLKAIPKNSKVLFMEKGKGFTLDTLTNMIEINDNFRKLYFTNDNND